MPPIRPLKVLLCNYEFPPLGGGGGTCSRYLARELVRRGHTVEVVTSHHRGLARDVEKGRFRLRRLPTLRKQRGQSNPLEMISYVAAAAPYLLLRWHRPDVVVSFHSIPSGLAAFPMVLLRQVPHVVLFRGGDVPGWLPGELESMHRRTLWLNRLIVYQAPVALANSDGLRDLAQAAFPRAAVGVLPNGVDVDIYSPPADDRAGRTGPVRLMFAGRITTQKGIDLIIRSLARPALRAMDWTLDLVGTGPMVEEYQALAQQLGVAGRITFHGWLDRMPVRDLYRQADVLVFPSRYEGMPNVVLEAMGTGLPVVGTRIAGTEELVEDGRHGYLVEVDDEAALADRVARLVGDAELRRTMGAAARQRVATEYSWQARAAQLEEHLMAAVGGRRDRR